VPSPLGHALAGAAAGWAIAGPSPHRHAARIWRSGALFAVLGMLPDVDLLFGIHRGPMHSIAAAVAAGFAIAALTRNGRMGLAAAGAYASHLLLDWLGTDSSPPIGIMALWPVSHGFYQSDAHLFGAISRRYWLPGFWAHNLRAIAWELIILVPLALLGFRMMRQSQDSHLQDPTGGEE
jgi:membrane-bound metal-dependent hydrolase YbcI (DUF457 family)